MYRLVFTAKPANKEINPNTNPANAEVKPKVIPANAEIHGAGSTPIVDR